MMITKNKKQTSLIRLRMIVILAVGLVFPLSSVQSDTLTLDLKQATKIALENNHDLVIAKYKIDEANAGVKSARTNFLPKLKSQASYTKLDEIPYLDASAFGSSGKIYIGDDDNYNINLSLQQPIFTGGKLINNHKISKYKRASAELLGQRTKETVRQQVTQAYWDLLSTQEFMKVTGEAIKQLESHVTDLKNLYDAGMVIKNDLLRAELALSNVRLRDVKVRNGVHLTNAVLCNLLVIDQNTVIIPTEKISVEKTELPSLDSLFQIAKTQRTDYQALDYNVKILNKVKAIKKAAYLPQIAFVANYDWNRPNREYAPEYYSSWNINLVATLDIFNWGQRHHEIQKVKAQEKQLTEFQSQLADYITLEVRQAYLFVQEALQEVDISKLAVTQAEENYRISSANYQAGVMTNSDLLDAQTSFTQAKITSIQSKANLKKAIVNLQTSISENKE